MIQISSGLHLNMYPPYAEKQGIPFPVLYEKSHCESLFYEEMQWLFLFSMSSQRDFKDFIQSFRNV